MHFVFLHMYQDVQDPQSGAERILQICIHVKEVKSNHVYSVQGCREKAINIIC